MGSTTKVTISGPPHGKPLIAHFLSNWLKPAVGAALGWAVLGAAVACAAEGSSFTFRKPALTVPELGQRVMLEVVRSGNVAGSASVEVVTLPGSATPGEDYQASQITLQFEPGQTNQFAFVQVIADPAQEAQETFLASLTNASSGATIDAPTQTTISINDSPHVTLSTVNETTIRAALAQGGVINLNKNFILSVTNALEVTKDIAIVTSSRYAIIDGVGLSRAFHVDEGVTLVLQGLTVRNGASDAGAGLYNAGGFVTLADCKFLANSSGGSYASETEPTRGGAVYNAGQLVITNCVFTTNTAQGYIGADDPTTRSKTGGAAQGGAVYNAGELWVENSAFQDNVAVGGKGGYNGATRYGYGGSGGTAFGGAIFNTNIARIFRTSIATNSALGGAGGDANRQDETNRGGGGGHAEAGAVYNQGDMELTECSYEFNAAVGNDAGYGYFSGSGGTARGGSIFNEGLLSVFSNCSFRSNQVAAGSGGGMKGWVSGNAYGGGIYNNAHASIDEAFFLGNQAYWGRAAGGAIYNAGSLFRASSSGFMSNTVTSGTEGDWYYGTAGFPGYGGAVMNISAASFTNCAFKSNHARGGTGDHGGGGAFGGAIANKGNLSIGACGIMLNSSRAAKGGYGGNSGSKGGDAAGGGIWTESGELNVLNTTIGANYALAGAGGDVPTGGGGSFSARGGDGGSAAGAGLYATNSSAAVTHCTFTSNWGSEGIGGLGSGLLRGVFGTIRGEGVCFETNSNASLVNTIVSGNPHENVWGSFTGDHNLINVQTIQLTYSTTNAFGTEYRPLMPDSPAIDAAKPLPNVQTDQSGVSRPFGSAPDIGATEWNGTTFYPYVRLTRLDRNGGHPMLKGVGPPGTTTRLQTSADLTNWTDSVTVEITTNGLFQVGPVPVPGQAKGFYRLLSMEK